MNTSDIPDPNTQILGPALEGACPTLTIHDSLVTTADHLDLAKEVLEEVFVERYGIKPMLDTK